MFFALTTFIAISEIYLVEGVFMSIKSKGRVEKKTVRLQHDK
jgi:hypothetical protein